MRSPPEDEDAFTYSDGRPVPVAGGLDLTALRDLLGSVPPEARDAILQAVEETRVQAGPGHGPWGRGTRLTSTNPKVAAILSRLYRRRDSAAAGGRERLPVSQRAEYEPIMLVVRVDNADAPAGAGPIAEIVHDPTAQPWDTITLRAGRIGPEQLHQAVSRLIGLRKTKDWNASPPMRLEVALRAPFERMPASWTAVLADALRRVAEAPIVTLPGKGPARAALLGFTRRGSSSASQVE